jgi:molybdopterin synthase catalytic subunit
MRVTVRLFAGAREIVGSATALIELPAGATAGEAIEALVREYPALRRLAAISRLAVDGEYAAAEQPLADGAELAVLPPVSGGAEHGVTTTDRLRHITREPISAAALAATLVTAEHGAVVTFEGVVRVHSRGKRILYLEYEAYLDMADRQIAAILAEARQRWPDTEVAAIHRTGRLEIGEVSVAIAAASPHRAEAFAACRFVIDTIKQRVPIWKKEVAEDGEEWIEGE